MWHPNKEQCDFVREMCKRQVGRPVVEVAGLNPDKVAYNKFCLDKTPDSVTYKPLRLINDLFCESVDHRL